MDIKNTILLVDDEPDLLKVLSLRLDKMGYRVHTASDGRQALDAAFRVKPDLVILDVYLPFIDGDEVAKILKADDRTRHIPIILISATMGSIKDRACGSGADGYLVKTFDWNDLKIMIKRLVG